MQAQIDHDIGYCTYVGTQYLNHTHMPCPPTLGTYNLDIYYVSQWSAENIDSWCGYHTVMVPHVLRLTTLINYSLIQLSKDIHAPGVVNKIKVMLKELALEHHLVYQYSRDAAFAILV